MESIVKFIKFRRKHLYLLIFISLGTLVKSDSCTITYENLFEEGVHYCNHNQSTTTCQSDITGFLIHEPNKDGTVDVEFDFDSNCIYELTLIYVKESEENCEYNPNKAEVSYHSRYTYEGRYLSSNDINPITEYCSKKGVIKLKHLSSGCYKLQMNNKIKSIKEYKSFTVNQTKIQFTHFNPGDNFKIDFYDDESSLNSSKLNATLTIIHPFFLQHPDVILKIYSYPFMQDNTIFNENIIPLVTNEHEVTKYRTCNSSKNDIAISCLVKEEDTLFECGIIGLNPGIYMFEYSLNNIIQCYDCSGCSYWKPCLLRSLPRDTEKEKQRSKPVTSPSQSSDTSVSILPWIIIIIILCLMMFIFIFVIYYRKCIWIRSGNLYNIISRFIKTASDSDISSSSKDNLSLIDNERDILLLYPRDAKEVMSTMEAFRNALIAEGFKVFDIFNEDHLRKISGAPNKWISDILDKNTTKVIIVRTYCGKILLDEGSSDAYRSPDYRDNLFVFAMARLCECYDSHDIFTVDVGMSTSYPYHLNRDPIYNLPENVQKLLQTLRNNSDYTINVENNNKWNEFTTSVEVMQDFVENEKYLKDILRIDFEENRKLSEDFDTDIKENSVLNNVKHV